jgi:hypothetical protein
MPKAAITRVVRVTPKVNKADYDAVKARLATVSKKAAQQAVSQEGRIIAWGSALGVAWYEGSRDATGNLRSLPELFGVEGKVVCGLALVIAGEVLSSQGSKSAREWGSRIAAAGDGAAILGIGDAVRRGSVFVTP